MTYPFARTVTWLQRATPGRDSDGNDTPTATAVDIQAVFDPGGSSETTQGGDTVTTQPTLYAVDPALGVAAVDGFLIDGTTYEVDGTPAVYVSPFTGWSPGVVVRLLAVSG